MCVCVCVCVSYIVWVCVCVRACAPVRVCGYQYVKDKTLGTQEQDTLNWRWNVNKLNM